MLIIPLLATFVINDYERQVQTRAFENLAAITDLKTRQLEDWFKEKSKVSQALTANPVLLANAHSLINNPDSTHELQALTKMFESLRNLFDFESISLVTLDQNKLVSVGNSHNIALETKLLIEKSIANQTPVNHYQMYDEFGRSHLDYVIPLIHHTKTHGEVFGLVLIHLDPNDFIFPYIRNWPTPSQSAETLLVRQSGQLIEVLNPVRHAHQHPLNAPSAEFDNPKLPANVALKERTVGSVIGLDYRNQKVYAAYAPVEGTDWMLISKIDMKEANQPLIELTESLILITFLALLIMAIALWIVLKKQGQSLQLQIQNEKIQSERVLQNFYEMPFIGMAILEPIHFRLTRFNQPLLSILGGQEDDLYHKTLLDFIDVQHHKGLIKTLDDIATNKQDGIKLTVKLRGEPNETSIVNLDIKCIRDDDGKPSLYLATLQDISELTQVFEQNAAQKRQLQTLINTIPDLIWVKDLNGIYLSCNRMFEKLYGAEENQIIGKSDYEFVDKETADFFRRHDLNAMKQGRPTENEEWLTFAQNQYRGLFSTIKTPVLNEQGKVIGILGIARDITVRKAAEEKLAQLSQLYATINEMNEAIVRCQNETELLENVCAIAVHYTGIQLAWIGLIDEHNILKPITFAGSNSDYIKDFEINLNEPSPSSQGPTGKAILENRIFWCQDFANSPITEPWHDKGKQAGWQSSAAIPLHQEGKVIGALNIYSHTLNAFDTAAQNLLTEMASNVSFALNNFAYAKIQEASEKIQNELLARLTKISQNLPGMVYQFRVTPEGVMSFPFASHAIKDIYLVEPEAVTEDASQINDLIHPEDLAGLHNSIFASAQTLTPWRHEYRLKYPDGTVRWLSGNAMPEKETDGSILWHGFITDITEQKNSQEKIALASKVFEQTHEGIMITDSQQQILLVNNAFTDITGFSAEDAIGKTPNILSSGKHNADFYQQIWQTLNQEGHWQGEIWNRRKNGELYPQLLSITRGKNALGEISEYIGMFSDISQVKASEEKIINLAHFDPLTQLANRQLLMDRLSHAVSSAERYQAEVAILFLDLDHFKNINDTLGHHIGDRLLIEVSQRMKHLLREEDTVSRPGGDEFIVLLPGTGEEGAVHVAEKLVTEISKQMALETYKVFITPSIGIAIYPQDGKDVATLLKNADAAMYQSKQEGRNTYKFFTDEMQQRSLRLMRIENALRSALDNQQLSLHYQPQFDAFTGQMIGAEALIRWNHPEMGSLSPAEFIPIAEQSGQIIPIGAWILKTALQELKTCLKMGYPPFTMAVNLSAVQFKQAELPQQVLALLNEYEISPEYLELELTESATMADPEAAIQMINTLVSCGIQIAIDDFGTGYSSLSYLKRFNATKLKIDQSFVRDIMDDMDDRAIVKTIISLAENLGLKTIAEGVETAEQMAFLQQENCREIQGYYLSKPLSAEDFETFLSENQAFK